MSSSHLSAGLRLHNLHGAPRSRGDFEAFVALEASVTETSRLFADVSADMEGWNASAGLKFDW